MKYVYMPDGKTVHEIQSEKDPLFPSLSIKKRFSADYLKHCVKVADDTVVETGWVFNDDTATFSEPHLPSFTGETEVSEEITSAVIESRIEALETELTVLRQQLAEKETEE